MVLGVLSAVRNITKLPLETWHVLLHSQELDFSQLYLIPPSTKYVFLLSITNSIRMSLWAVANTAFLYGNPSFLLL